MLEKLCPCGQADSIFALDPRVLQEQGIRGVIFDLDNTLVEWGADTIGQDLATLIEHFKASGLKLCIVSNALSARVEAISAALGIPAIPQATKPSKIPFRRALKIMGTGPEETAVVGDQLFTDILGGNRMDLYTIWTLPISETELVSTKAVRHLEKLVARRFRKRGLLA